MRTPRTADTLQIGTGTLARGRSYTVAWDRDVANGKWQGRWRIGA